jgi:hypothetical protein
MVFCRLCVGLFCMSCASASVDFRATYAGKCQVSSGPFPADVVQDAASVAAFKVPFSRGLGDEIADFRRCYIAALANVHGTHGRVTLHVVVGADGQVRDATVAEDTTGFPELACCVTDVLRGIRFERQRQHSAIGLAYPFVFRTLHTYADTSVDFSNYSAARPDGVEIVLDAGTYDAPILLGQ